MLLEHLEPVVGFQRNFSGIKYIRKGIEGKGIQRKKLGASCLCVVAPSG